MWLPPPRLLLAPLQLPRPPLDLLLLSKVSPLSAPHLQPREIVVVVVERRQFEFEGGGEFVQRGEFGGRGVRRNVAQEDGEGGAAAVQRGVRGDRAGAGGGGVRGGGGHVHDSAAAEREERRGDSGQAVPARGGAEAGVRSRGHRVAPVDGGAGGVAEEPSRASVRGFEREA